VPTKQATTSAAAGELLMEVHALAEAGSIPAATDLIFSRIDRLLCDGAFEACDEILRQADPHRLQSSLRRSFPAITTAARAMLPARAGFFEASLALLAAEIGEDAARKRLDALA